VKTGPASVSPGGSITYTLTVTNNGPSTATAPVVSDMLPSDLGSPSTSSEQCAITLGVLACTSADLVSGATFVATVTGTAPAAGSLSNTATVSSETADPIPANNTSTWVTTVDGQADLQVVKTGPASVNAAGSISYTLTVTNNGPSTAAAPVVSDTLPLNLGSPSTSTPGCAITVGVLTCTSGDLADGATFVVTVSGTAPASGEVTNTAAVSSETADPIPANNTSTLVTAVTPQADLEIVKRGPATVDANRSITYTLTVTNHGPSTAVAPVVTDMLPGNLSAASTSTVGCAIGAGVLTCHLAELLDGGTFVATVTGMAPPSGTVMNTAAVTSATADPDLSNNSSAARSRVEPVVGRTGSSPPRRPAAPLPATGSDVIVLLNAAALLLAAGAVLLGLSRRRRA